MTVFHTHSAAETAMLGKTFAKSLLPGDVVALSGNLGAGKTQFIAGVCEGLGVKSNVSSPTFTLIHEYQTDSVTVVHVDLYRLSSKSEVLTLGLEEYFDGSHVCLIEWAEKILDLLPDRYHMVKIEHGDNVEERRVNIEEITSTSIAEGYRE